MDKNSFRRDVKQEIRKLKAQELITKSELICKKLCELEAFRRSGLVMAYLSLPNEVDTGGVILEAWRNGKTVAVPKVSWQQRHMIPVQINSLETGFSTEVSGLKNPTTGVPVPLEDIDIVITPGIAFDRNGNRLGRGGGYFDRFFASKELRAVKCAICFSEQVVDEVPYDETDVPVDYIITDKEILDFTNK